MDDRNAFGELVFEDDSAGKHPLELWRAQYYSTTYEIPAAWRELPDPLPGPLTDWVFRTDPLEQGLEAGWQETDVDEAGWARVRIPAFWAEIEGVGKYLGYGWYRTRFTVPAAQKGQALRLLFAGVDEQAWVYVNGHLVREHTEKSEGIGFGELWETPFTADVPPDQLRLGDANVLTVRVRNDRANGGIWRPVLAHFASP